MWEELLPVVILVVLLIGALALLYVNRDRSRRELARHRRTDPVAGALTEAAFLTELRRQLALGARHDFPVAVALIAVEGVRRVNQSESKAAGNALLREVAAAWRETLREGDVLARPGGTTFAVLLPHVGKAGGRETLDRLLALAPAKAEAFGAVSVHEGDESAEALLHRADVAMRRSRRISGELSPSRPRHVQSRALA